MSSYLYFHLLGNQWNWIEKKEIWIFGWLLAKSKEAEEIAELPTEKTKGQLE